MQTAENPLLEAKKITATMREAVILPLTVATKSSRLDRVDNRSNR